MYRPGGQRFVTQARRLAEIIRRDFLERRNLSAATGYREFSLGYLRRREW